MNQKKTILVCCVFYFICTVFLFVQNKLFAKEESHLNMIIEKEEIISKDKRAMLRAFYTSPPVVPHEVVSRDAKTCLECHANVTVTADDRVAMQTPHPQFSSCLQCHVPSQPGINKSLESDWEGLKEPKRGDRWFTVSPPTMPHRVTLRENCLSCHGPENPDMQLRTPHPQRTSCLQCHVPDYRNEFNTE